MIELLWVRNVDRRPVKKPVAILSSASPRVLGEWRRKNTWCDNVPLTTFGDRELWPHGEPFNDFPRDPIPWRVDNAPPKAVDSFKEIRSAFPMLAPNERAWELYKIAARRVAVEVAPIGEPVWVLAADDDQGLLAVVAAHARGGKVAAIAGGEIGLIGASVAADLGVNVGVLDKRGGLR